MVCRGYSGPGAGSICKMETLPGEGTFLEPVITMREQDYPPDEQRVVTNPLCAVLSLRV